MDYNFHTHTARCGHASGTEEEYIRRAIDGGIKYMGFSDHVPVVFEDGHESYFRIPIAEVGDYRRTLLDLREKYRGQLEMHIGFEMEYYPAMFDIMLKKALEYGAEYLILGQHFIGEELKDRHVYNDIEDPALLVCYTDCVTAGMKTGVFSYVAHPDIPRFNGDPDIYRTQMLRICEASLALNLPLEINMLGIRDKRNYPDARFWELAGQVGCPVTFGFDAHDPEGAYDSRSIPVAMQMVRDYHLNYIGKPTLIPLNK